jgi:hypothetical protein
MLSATKVGVKVPQNLSIEVAACGAGQTRGSAEWKRFRVTGRAVPTSAQLNAGEHRNVQLCLPYGEFFFRDSHGY